MDKQLTVLITRPQPGADAFAESLDDLPMIISPVMVIEPVASDLGAPDVVVITSAHALPSVPVGTWCYCVGSVTTQKALDLGLDAVMAGPTAEAVAQRIIADRPSGQIVYARGRHVAFDMVGALRQAGLQVCDVEVYDQVARPLSPQARALLQSGAPVILPLFSARSAALFFDDCPSSANLRIIAISDAVAKTVPQTHIQHLSVLPNPDAATMTGAVRMVASGGKRLEQGQ